MPTSADISSKTKNKVLVLDIASPDMNHIEAQTIIIPLTQNKKLTITNMYIPQKTTVTSQQDEDAGNTSVFTRLLDIPYSLIAGDLNAHSQTWYATQK